MKQFDFASISRSRKMLMGFSALWLALYHSNIWLTRMDGSGISHFLYILDYNVYMFKKIGEMGTDILLFLSAIGLYFSLKRDPGIKRFYSKRIRRIIPEYLIVSFVWELYNTKDIGACLSNVFGLSFFLNGYHEYWFVILILFLYLIYPLCFSISEKIGNNCFLILIVVSFIANYIISLSFPNLFCNVEIALSRIPVFLFGCFISKNVYEKKNVSYFLIVFCVVLLFICYFLMISDYFFLSPYYRYFFGISSVCIVLVFSFANEVICLNNLKCGFKLFSFYGDYSFEVYLLFDKIVKFLTNNFPTINMVIIALISFMICTIMSVYLKKVPQIKFVKGFWYE